VRIGIIGAGAIGGTYAALLDRAGHEVVVTARGEALDAIRTGGLQLNGAWGDHVARIGAAMVLPERPDLALLTVKAQDARGAAEQHAALLAGVPVIVVQNGLNGPQALHDVLPDSPLIGGLSMIAAAYLTPGVVTVTNSATTVLAADTATREQLVAAADVLRTAVPVHLADDLVGAQWSKLAVNQLNFSAAVSGVSVQAALLSPLMRRAVVTAMRETVAVGLAAGVRFGGLPALTPGVLRLIRFAPIGLTARVLGPRFAAGMGPVPNLGSTLQSIERGRPSEIDHLSGAVVQEGARLGVATPVNRRVVELVHEVEHTHEFVPPDRAARRLLG
jgi:2-dehydropantoate 2-reductase